MKNIILVCFLLFQLTGLAQDDCRFYNKYIGKGDSIIKKGDKADFQAAINAYSTAMLHCPEKAEEARKKVLDVFRKIDTLKTKAEQAEKKARVALSEAEKAKIDAIMKSKMVLESKLTAQAEVIRNNYPSHIERSILLALKSIQVHYTPEAEEVLRKSLALFPRTINKSAHIESIGNLFVSTNNKWLATVSSDKTATVWNIEAGKKIFEVNYESPIKFVALDSQSRYLATINADSSVALWEVNSGKNLYRFKNQSKIKEQGLVTASNRTAVTRRVTSRLARKNGLTFSPDGRYLAIANEDSTVHLVDIPSLEIRFILKSFLPVNDIKFSPNGALIAGRTDLTINVWGVVSGEEKCRIELINGDQQFALDPEGRYLATTSNDTSEIATLWDVHTGKKIAKVGEALKDGRGYLVGFSPDGNFLWTITTIGIVAKWDVSNQREIVRFQNNVLSQQLLSISSDGKYIATAGAGNMVRMWNALDGQELARFIQDSEISSLTFIDSSKYLAAANVQGRVKIWETENANAVAKFYQPHLRKISFSADEKSLLTYGSHARMTSSSDVWNIPGKVKMFHKRNTKGLVFDAIISDNGKFLYSTSKDSVWKYDLETGNILAKIKLEGDNILGAGNSNSVIAFSPNGDYLIKTLGRRSLLWKIDAGSQLMRLELPAGIIKAVFSPRSSHLVTISLNDSSENVVEIFDLKNDRRIVKQQFDPGTLPVFAISYDDKYIAFPDRDITSNTRIVNLKNNKEEFKPLIFPREFDSPTTNDGLTALAFSPDGEYLIGGQANGNASVFHIKTGNEIARVNHVSGISQVLFSPEHNYIATAGADGFAKLWLWRQDDVIKSACSFLTRNFTLAEWRRYFGDIQYTRVCPNLPSHPSILEEAQKRARLGDIDEAVKIINLDPSLRDTLKMDPRKWAIAVAAKEAAKETAAALIKQGVVWARKGATTRAIESFTKAQQLDPEVKISAGEWNNLAWHAAIRNQAELVTEAINNALELEPDNGGFRDTRGVIRALTGDFKGAIEDFKYYVSWGPYNQRARSAIDKREKWIEELSAGRNPFDANTLQGLITPFWD